MEKKKKNKVKFKRSTLPKSPTSIQGLDEITGGGLPKGRPTLVCGGAGCGKTLFAMEFLVRGAMESIGAKRVVLDTIESLFSELPNPLILRAELRRLFQWLKKKGVTTIITA